MDLRLYYAPGSSAFAALAALEVARADYQPVRLELAVGDQRCPAFLGISPLGRVPALTVDGTAITEVIGVLTFIAAQFPQSRLLSFDDPLRLAREYEWMGWFASSLHIHIAQVFRGERFGEDAELLARLKQNGIRQFTQDVQIIAQQCAGRNPILSTSRFTMINALSIVAWRWAERLEIGMSASMDAWSKVVAHDLGLPQIFRAIEVEGSTVRWQAPIATNA